VKLTDKKKIISEVKALLLKHYPDKIEKVLLFGSQITDTAKKYSDYDVLIILKNKYDWHLKNDIFALCYDIDLKYDILLDVKIISKYELSTLRGKQPFILNALAHGIAV